MGKMQIAIVEDDADDRQFIQIALQEIANDLIIRQFATGTDFLDYLATHSSAPDVIVTDLRMPVVSGFEVIKSIKENQHTSLIPVYVLSTSGNEQDIDKATRLGAAGYFVKPTTLDEYCRIGKKILSGIPGGPDLFKAFSTWLEGLRQQTRGFGPSWAAE